MAKKSIEIVEEENAAVTETVVERKEKNKNFLLAACIVIYIIISLIAGYTIYYIYKRPNTYGLTLSLNIISLILAFAILIGAFIIHVKYKNHVSIAKYIYCVVAIIILFWNIYYIYKSKDPQSITSTQNTATTVVNSLLIIFSVVLIIFSIFFTFKRQNVEKMKNKSKNVDKKYKVKNDKDKNVKDKNVKIEILENEKGKLIKEMKQSTIYKSQSNKLDNFSASELPPSKLEVKKEPVSLLSFDN